jgi:hypothetical protein
MRITTEPGEVDAPSMLQGRSEFRASCDQLTD